MTGAEVLTPNKPSPDRSLEGPLYRFSFSGADSIHFNGVNR